MGLHPVWLILALSVFGTLFGFAGLLVAVPVAAALGVIWRFLVERYRESALFTGQAPPERRRALSRVAAARPGPSGPAGARAGGLLRRRRRTSWRWRRSTPGRAGPAGGWRWRGPRVRARRTSPMSGRRGAGRAILADPRGRARSRRAAAATRRWRSRTWTGWRGTRAAEEALFHLCNRLAAGGGSLMVSGREPPARWPLALPDLASRLGAARGGAARAAGRRPAGGGAGQALRRPAARGGAGTRSAISSAAWSARSRRPSGWWPTSTGPGWRGHRPITARLAAEVLFGDEPDGPRRAAPRAQAVPALFRRARLLALRGADGDRGAGLAGLCDDRQRLPARPDRAGAVPAGGAARLLRRPCRRPLRPPAGGAGLPDRAGDHRRRSSAGGAGRAG